MTTAIAALATPTFGVFVTATRALGFNAGTERINVRFKDQNGITRGSTSVAVRTPGTVPDISGNYRGTETGILSQCTDPANNGGGNPDSAVVNISNQTGANFSGTATLTSASGNSVTQVSFNNGTVTQSGAVSSTPFTFTLTNKGSQVGGGSGTFTGQSIGNTLTLTYTGAFNQGETCLVNGSFLISRP